jgi:YfiH family protein
MFDIRKMILPTPATPFRWQSTPAGPALVCGALESMAPHLFTTRWWKLGSRDAADSEDTRWAEVAGAMETPAVVRLHQVHGCQVFAADAITADRPDADIVIGMTPGVAVAVQAADCVPLLVADRRTGAVAAAHAGWRGLAARVPIVTIDALVRRCGSRREDLVAAAGPSIGACCYEVGKDVVDAFSAAGFAQDDMDGWFLDGPKRMPDNASMPGVQRRTGHWFFDGWSCVGRQLELAGVPRDQIFVAGLCTASHPDLLPSFRRDGPPAGRLAAAIKSAARRP